MQYQFSYRCRRCGVVFGDATTRNKQIADEALSTALATGKFIGCGAAVYKETAHFCKDGGRGVADIIGYDVK